MGRSDQAGWWLKYSRSGARSRPCNASQAMIANPAPCLSAAHRLSRSALTNALKPAWSSREPVSGLLSPINTARSPHTFAVFTHHLP
ncbi:hypothetical protein D3C81_1769190 [compost metagenome]